MKECWVGAELVGTLVGVWLCLLVTLVFGFGDELFGDCLLRFVGLCLVICLRTFAWWL